MIIASNLSKIYKKTTVLSIQDLKIKNGQSFGLIGNNGAGKTTFFNLLLDLILPTTGKIINNNVVVHKSEDWKVFTSAFIDESFLIGYLTAEEYFYFIGGLRDQNKIAIDNFLNQFKDFFNDEVLGKKKYLRDYSKGNQKKIGIVATFIGNLKTIILDEPFANLDPTSQIKLKEIIKSLIDIKEMTILISSHDLMHITDVCERIVILEKGYIVKDVETKSISLTELRNHFRAQ